MRYLGHHLSGWQSDTIRKGWAVYWRLIFPSNGSSYAQNDAAQHAAASRDSGERD